MFNMWSRLRLLCSQPAKALRFAWTLWRMLLLAVLNRLLFPFACHPISIRTELRRCYLGASLSCFLELIFSAPSHLDGGDFGLVPLGGVETVVVPPVSQLEDLADCETIVLLYAHGGGYHFGEPLMYLETYKRWVHQMQQIGTKLVVIAVDYRMIHHAVLRIYWGNQSIRSHYN